VQVKPEPTAEWIKIARLAGDVPPASPVSPAAVVGSPEQQQTFAQAATAQRDGNFAAAADALRGLATSADGEVASAASLRLGQTLLAEGRGAEALQQLQPLDSADAAFLQGRALAALGRCGDAVPQYQRFVDAAGAPLRVHGQIAIANCQLDLGRGGEAITQLQEALATSDLPRLQVIDLRERLALARVRAGDLEGARADYTSLLSAAKSDGYRAELNYVLGVIAPDAATAASQFRTAVQLDPKSRAAQSALDELESMGDSFANSFEAGDTRFEQNRYREALAAYTSFIQANPSSTRVPKAYYGRGVSLVRLNQDRAGVVVLESIGQRFPGTPDSADGMFRGGRIRESLADLDGAARSYRAVMSQPGAGVRAADAQFRLAFVLFRQGRFAEAAAGWRDLSGRVSAAEDRAQAQFWLGKALAASGDRPAASSAWTAARDADPRGFYGLRADDLLSGRSDPRAALEVTAPIVQWHVDDDPGADLRMWAASRGDVAAASARLAADPGLVRAEQLLGLGQ